MGYSKVVAINEKEIIFDDGKILFHDHEKDCCETHYLDFKSLSLEDFEGLEFNLDREGKFFRRVPGYGIELIPVNGWAVRIAGYGINNGFYSDNLCLCLQDGDELIEFDITDCQDKYL